MKLIFGLGNPGEKYVGTRHNLGFKVVEELGKSVKGQGESWKYEEKFKSEILSFTLNASRFTLVKPQTYMNNSGMAVRLLMDYYKLQSTDVIIVYDELDLPLGKIKVRVGGASAGHHGVESIMEHLGSDQFTRVRLGIGPAVGPAEKFVLELFKSSEKPQVKQMIGQAVKALDLLSD